MGYWTQHLSIKTTDNWPGKNIFGNILQKIRNLNTGLSSNSVTSTRVEEWTYNNIYIPTNNRFGELCHYEDSVFSEGEYF